MAVVSFFLPFLCGSLIRETVKEPTRTVAEVVAKKKRQKLECNHILPIVFRLLGYSLSTKKKLKVSAFEDFSLSVPCTMLLSIPYTTFITICPTLFSSKTKSALLENGDISVEFLSRLHFHSARNSRKRSLPHKRGGLRSKRHTKSLALAFRNEVN